MIEIEVSKNPKYRPYTVICQMRNVKELMLIQGGAVKRYLAPVITEYVDMETGEIIPAENLRNNPELWPEMRTSERLYQRAYFLKSLREEVRKFAQFTLKFRNQRRGVTPGIETLIKWYAFLYGKRPCDVRRYLRVLIEKEFLVHEGLLNPLFQRAGKKAVARDHQSEEFVAGGTFLLMCMKQKNEGIPFDMKEAA